MTAALQQIGEPFKRADGPNGARGVEVRGVVFWYTAAGALFDLVGGATR